MTGDKFSHPWCTGKLSTDAGGSKRAQALYKSMTDWEVVCIFHGRSKVGMAERKRWDKLAVQMRVNIVGLKGILWKTCLQGWPLAGIRELEFRKAPITLNDNSGLYWTPTFFLGVWNFDNVLGRGCLCYQPPIKTLGHLVLSFPGIQHQNFTTKNVDRSKDGKSRIDREMPRWVPKGQEVCI